MNIQKLIAELNLRGYDQLAEAIKAACEPDETPQPPAEEAKDKPVIALCVGHSREGDAGATSASGESEWGYWSAWAREFKAEYPDLDIRIVDAYAGNSYTEAMTWLASHLRNEVKADYAIELHFNAYNGQVRGFEALYWHASEAGEALALSLAIDQETEFPDKVARGAKPIKWSHGRGYQFLRKTHCPAVIWEPFFGDNPEEDEFYRENSERLMSVLATVLEGLE